MNLESEGKINAAQIQDFFFISPCLIYFLLNSGELNKEGNVTVNAPFYVFFANVLGNWDLIHKVSCSTLFCTTTIYIAD